MSLYYHSSNVASGHLAYFHALASAYQQTAISQQLVEQPHSCSLSPQSQPGPDLLSLYKFLVSLTAWPNAHSSS